MKLMCEPCDWFARAHLIRVSMVTSIHNSSFSNGFLINSESCKFALINDKD